MLQQMSQTGRWIELANADQIIALVIAFEATLPEAFLRRSPLQTTEEVLAHLAAGENLVYGQDWYNKIRQLPTPVLRPAIVMVRCDCGHDVPQGRRMSASLGTSCPDCYDRMSD